MTEADKLQRFNEVYATLRERFIQRTRQQRIRLVELQSVFDGQTATEAELKEVEHLCHTLHGSAGTFGFPEIGVISSEAELVVRQLIKKYQLGEMTADALSEMKEPLQQLCASLEQI